MSDPPWPDVVLRRALKRRWRVEGIAGAMAALWLAADAARLGLEADWVPAAANLLLVAGVIVVLQHLWRFGTAPPGPPDEPRLEAHRRELAWQVDLLRAVPRWYLAPFLPGMGAVLLSRMWGGSLASVGIAGGVTLGLVALTFLFVWRLNTRGAGRLQAQLDALPPPADGPQADG